MLLGTADPDGDSAAQQAAFSAAFPALKDRGFFLYLSRIHPKKGCDLLIQRFCGSWFRNFPPISIW